MPAPRRRLPRQARPGEPLGFARTLRAAKHWPPTRIRRDHHDVPPATPFIVVPIDPADTGARPVPGDAAEHSASVELVDAAGAVVDAATPGDTYTLRATLRNVGPAAAYAGVVEFALADVLAIDAAPTHAIEGFLAQPGSTVVVTCRRPWTPADEAEAARSVVVCAYDALLDRPEHRFDAHADRHVGRRDLLPDFSGTWDGLQFFAAAPPGQGFLYRVVVEQTGPAVDVSIFEEITDVGPVTPAGRPAVGGTTTVRGGGPGRGLSGSIGGTLTKTLPGAPQLSGTGTIAGGRVALSLIGLNGQPPAPFTTDEVVLTLPAPDTLHVTQHEEFVDPADPRGPLDFVADLTRTA